jgi:hypothetical protein
MEDTQRTLVILLSMHRSGSSLTANVFMALPQNLWKQERPLTELLRRAG